MFSVVRSVLAGVVVSLLLLLIHRYKPLTKKIAIGSAIGWIVLSLALSFLPFENSFVTFSSPEAAYKYYYPTASPYQIIKGNESDLVLGDGRDGTTTILIVPKNEDGWKVGIGSEINTVYNGIAGTLPVQIHRYKDSNDYYITVFGEHGKELSISDNRGSTFASDLQLRNVYRAHIADMNRQYELTVNGEKIDLFQAKHILINKL
ncbi:MAG: hypothetical protein IJO76_02135 [Clostridia bacterium]|nr:hypothetical protein [Clostridia bacterium]